MCIWKGVHETHHEWRSEDNFVELLSSFHYVGFRDRTLVVRCAQQVPAPAEQYSSFLISLYLAFPSMPSIRIEIGPGKWTVPLQQGISTNDNKLYATAIVFSGYIGKGCSLKSRGRLEAASGWDLIVVLVFTREKRNLEATQLPHMAAAHIPLLCLSLRGLGAALEYLSFPPLSRLSISSCCGKAWSCHGDEWGHNGIKIWSCLGHRYIVLTVWVSSSPLWHYEVMRP